MNIITHYDKLIDEENDPFRDPQDLREYMDKWDGPEFVADMELTSAKCVLEIGVGTGRLAAKTAPLCGSFTGIDISPKTIARARENLSALSNAELICGDFLAQPFSQTFDVIYTSLTMMHFEDKQAVISKAAGLLRRGGRFCLSIDKNPADHIDMGTRRLKIYPDSPTVIAKCAAAAELTVLRQYESEFAHIIICVKSQPC